MTLFASGDSLIAARLVAPCERALRLEPQCIDPLAHHITMLELIKQESRNFDIIHFHIDYLHFPIFQHLKLKTLTTLHGRLDIPDLVPLYKQFSHLPLTSISFSQRKPLPWVNWIGNVYPGLPSDQHTFRKTRGGYLAFLGKISPEKRMDRAIAIAKDVGIPIRIAAKVDKVDQAYFEENIQPLLRHPLVDYFGEIGRQEKDELLGNAKALLFPVDWPEPFGLVMIEALACGTPVVAYQRGAVSEVLEQGVTGFIVRNHREAVEAIKNLEIIDRLSCRKTFEERFTAATMAKHYLSLYSSLLRLGPESEAA